MVISCMCFHYFNFIRYYTIYFLSLEMIAEKNTLGFFFFSGGAGGLPHCFSRITIMGNIVNIHIV